MYRVVGNMLEMIDRCTEIVVKCSQHFENCTSNALKDIAERKTQCQNTD